MGLESKTHKNNMTAISTVLVCLLFGLVFWLAGLHLSGTLQKVVQFLAGLIIVVVLIIFLLGLFGNHLP